MIREVFNSDILFLDEVVWKIKFSLKDAGLKTYYVIKLPPTKEFKTENITK